MPTELTSKNFPEFIKKGITLVDFYADWCMPCVMMAPVVEEISKKFVGKVAVGKVNVDDEGKLAQKYGIRSIPTFAIFKDGKIAEQLSGSISEEGLTNKLKKHL